MKVGFGDLHFFPWDANYAPPARRRIIPTQIHLRQTIRKVQEDLLEQKGLRSSPVRHDAEGFPAGFQGFISHVEFQRILDYDQAFPPGGPGEGCRKYPSGAGGTRTLLGAKGPGVPK